MSVGLWFSQGAIPTGILEKEKNEPREMTAMPQLIVASESTVTEASVTFGPGFLGSRP